MGGMPTNVFIMRRKTMNPTKYDEAEYITCCKSDYEKLLADRDKWLNQTIEDSDTITKLQAEIDKADLEANAIIVKLQAELERVRSDEQCYYKNLQKADAEIAKLQAELAKVKVNLGFAKMEKKEQPMLCNDWTPELNDIKRRTAHANI
jgi:chromosome segregation ATPase